MNQSISRAELKAMLDSGVKLTLIEALPRKYYAAEHLPGAINMPLDEVQANATRLIPGQSGPVVVYCASSGCRNSHVAAEELRKLGYSGVLEYTEGKAGWKEAGLPLVSGEAAA